MRLQGYDLWMWCVVHPIDESCNSFIIWQWHVPVCALFKGRLVDTPEAPMSSTEHTSGGEIEHEVSMAEGILLEVFKLKLYFKNERDHLAQVFLQLDCK
jgi:hypothetical protein